MRNLTAKQRDKSTTAALNDSFIDVRTKKSGEEVCSFSSVAAAITDEIFPIAVRQEESGITEASSSGTKQNKGQNNHNSSSSKQQQQKKQPLFAAVIQKWLLEERMKARGVPLGSKSSKKKKKKEKKGDQTPTHDDGGDNSADEESAMAFLENGATMSRSTSQSSAASPSSSRKLDCILDKFIEGIDDCELNIVEGRDLHAFTTFLGRKFESYLDEQKQQQSTQKKAKAASIKSSLQDTNNLHCGTDFEEVLPTILMADVNSNAQKAKCACGHAIRSHLNTWTDKYQSVKQTIVLEAKTEDDEDDIIVGCTNENNNGLSIPVCSNYLDADNDDPFAYGALIDDEFDIEAGAPSTETKAEKIENSSTLRLELRQISSPTDAGRYLQVDPVCTQNDGGGEYVYPIDEQSILNLVKWVIVPSGINDDDDIECALNDKDIHFIKERAEMSENSFLHQFYEMLRVAENCKTKVNASHEEQSKRTIFDPKASNYLKDADEQLNLLLLKICQFLIRVTEYSCCVGWLSENPTPISIVTQLWKEFEKIQIDLVKPALKVRGTGIQVKGRPGKVPQAFCNTAVLNSYDQFVCLKLDKLDRLLYLMRSEFLNRPDCNRSKFLKTNIPSQMLRLCVLEAYGMRRHNLNAGDMFPKECRECLDEMLRAKTGLPQVNKHSTLKAVERDEKDRLERLKVAYKKVVEIVTKADARLTCLTSPDVAFLVSGAERYESKRLDYELEEKKPSESASFLSLDDEDNPAYVNLEEDIIRALNKSEVLLMQWIHILSLEIYSKSPNKKFHINRELKLYMDGEIKNPCEGGGERKVSVILATLIYRWLEAKFNEWHAELTREELLQEAMELTKPKITTKVVSSKKSKKKKSKKKKKARDENTETSRAVSVIDSSSSNVDREDVKDAGIGSERVETVNEEIEDSVTFPILNVDLDDNFHSTSDAGWTTVGAKTTSEVDAKTNEEIDTARDEEIARALQEQYQEEAREYKAENNDNPLAQEGRVKSVPSIVQEEEVVPDSAPKVSDKVKTSKQSKSEKIKAKQTRIVDAKNIAAKQAVTDDTGGCPKSQVGRPDKSQDEAKADKTRKDTAQRCNAVKSDSAKADKSVALKSQTNAFKKKQVATQAAAKMNSELSTDDCAKSVNSATGNNDEGDTKQEQVTPQAAAVQTNEYRPKVGVYEEDQFVDAETYLVERMKRVQKKPIWL